MRGCGKAGTGYSRGALIRRVRVDGKIVAALVDCGCSVTLIGEAVVKGRQKGKCGVRLETMNRSVVEAQSVVHFSSVLFEDEYELGPVDAFVAPTLPTGVEMVLGLDVILRHGMSISVEGGVVFHSRQALACSEVPHEAVIEDEDFRAEFRDGRWEVGWKFVSPLAEGVSGSSWSSVPESHREAFDAEMASWLEEGIIVKHEEKHGEIRRFLPMISVRQEKGQEIKIRPVFDYREMNKSIASHPAGATPLCSERLREWRQVGSKASIIDLRKAYLQVHAAPELWCQQAIRWKGEVFVMTRLGFGLASAPKIMTAIVEKVISENDRVHAAVSSYIDDLYVDESKISGNEVRAHFAAWGLETKPVQHLGPGQRGKVRVLGVCVDENQRWGRDSVLSQVDENTLTRRQVHSIVGEWVGHLPVAGWLRVACGYVQRMTAEMGAAWDDRVSPEVMGILKDISARLLRDGDPAKGNWEVSREAPVIVWSDASSLAMGVVIEIDGNIVEDAAWLRPQNDTAHINRAELDALIRGLNLAIKWGRREMRLMCDSSTVCNWMKSILENNRNVKTRALGEVLIRRRLDTVREIIAQEGLQVSIQFVKSEENKADALTRVPKKWEKIDTIACSALTDGSDSWSLQDLVAVHQRGHFGVERTLQLARERYGSGVSKKSVKKVISRCHQCSRIDPAITFHWDRGNISAPGGIWQRLAVDLTHFDGIVYLTVTDVASGFTVWRSLKNESGREVAQHFRQLFSEFGAPQEILSDNGTVFRGREVEELLQRWEVCHTLTCAYRSQGNGVAERVHRTVKRAARRAGFSVEEAVFWVNNTSGGRDETPYELVFCAKARKPGISDTREELVRADATVRFHDSSLYSQVERNPFKVGNQVYLRPASGRCDEPWGGPHVVTCIRSSVSVELDHDGISRHVSHLRRVPPAPPDGGRVSVNQASDEVDENRALEGLPERQETVAVRRSERTRRRPEWFVEHVE